MVLRARSFVNETDPIRRKMKILKEILKNYEQWKVLVEEHGVLSLSIDGDEYHFHDILEGIERLPPRQREALWKLCIENKKEVEVAREMGFTRWSTPVQQYRNHGLFKLVKWHEEKKKAREEE